MNSKDIEKTASHLTLTASAASGGASSAARLATKSGSHPLSISWSLRLVAAACSGVLALVSLQLIP